MKEKLKEALNEEFQVYNPIAFYTRLAELFSEYRNEIKPELLGYIERCLVDVCKKHDVSVRWLQYTPYFNDGDECVFSVHCFEPFRVNEEGDERNIGYYKAQPMIKDFNQVFSEFSDDDFLWLYGDHAQIIVTEEDGLTIKEYEDW